MSDPDISQTVSNIKQGFCCHLEESVDRESACQSSLRLVHLAASLGHVNTLQELASLGCDLSAKTQPHKCTPLWLAARHDRLQAVRYLIGQSVDVNATSAHRMYTPLMLAIHSRSAETVACLLAQPHINVNAVDHKHHSALYAAASANDIHILRLLLEAGADTNICSGTDRSPLIQAAEQGIKCVSLLLEHGANVNYTNKEDDTALQVAVSRGDVGTDIVECLLKAGADPNIGPSRSERNLCVPLATAVWRCDDDRMAELLLYAGAHPDTRLRDGTTPLALAAQRNKAAFLHKLLKLKCNVNNVDNDLDTPLHCTAFNGMTESVKSLLKLGADPNAHNYIYATPLWNAVCMNHIDIVKLLLQVNAELDVPPSMGIHHETYMQMNPLPRSLLWVAVDKKYPAMVQLVVMAGYDIYHEEWLIHRNFPPVDPDKDGLNRHQVALEIQEYLKDCINTPRSLLDSCIRLFRKRFGPSIHERLDMWDIPKRLKDLMKLNDMLSL